ncbi:membrane protein, partial [Elstera litoralis]
AGFPQTGAPASWGRWFRAVDVTAGRGQVVMTGPDASPLVILDRVGEGRVAQILSDQLWLWSRGYDGGGPQAELLRRLAHWLMKEPTLEEEDLVAAVRGEQLHITRRSLTPAPTDQRRFVTVTDPDGSTRNVTLTERNGVATGSATLSGPGVYRLAEGSLQRVIAVGTVNPKEMSDVRATETVLQPVSAATGGAIQWLRDGIPDLRRVEPGRTTSGRGWIGLPERRDYDITGLTRLPLLPAWLMLLLAGGALGMAWWREGR